MRGLKHVFLISALIQTIILKTQATDECDQTEYEDCLVLNGQSCLKDSEKSCSYYALQNNEITEPKDNGCPKNCHEIKTNDLNAESGLYRVWPTYMNTTILVYCDMKTTGGGWTVFQRRTDNVVNHISFNRTWKEYKEGFGNLHGEFWLGNDAIFALTNEVHSELRIEMEDFQGRKTYAIYAVFQILSEMDDYKLLVNIYSGDAGKDGMKTSSACAFQTPDRKKDHCPEWYGGGWWFCRYKRIYCFYANLNGFYTQTLAKGKPYNAIFFCGDWKRPLKFTEMKTRPKMIKSV